MNADDIIAQLEQRKNEITIGQKARLKNVATSQAPATQQTQSNPASSLAAPSAFGQMAQQLGGSPSAPAAPVTSTKSATGGQITPTATGLMHTAKPADQTASSPPISTIQDPKLAAKQDAAISAARTNMATASTDQPAANAEIPGFLQSKLQGRADGDRDKTNGPLGARGIPGIAEEFKFHSKFLNMDI